MATLVEVPSVTPSQQPEEQFIERVGNYPVVVSTVDQMKNIYTKFKEANALLKYSLETAESGAKLITDTAAPVVEKLPISTVNKLALSQLDRLEEKYPIVTKPTDEVLEETKKLYETTLKPSVDKVQGYGQLATDTYQNAKDKVEGYGQLATEKYQGAKDYGYEKYEDVKDYGYTKVQDITKYGTEKADQLRQIGTEKLNTFIQSPQGQVVVQKLDQAIAYAETYVDKYLPEGEETDTTSADQKPPRTRLYNRTMKELKNLQLRSQETLKNLHFTVDLIEYARTNIDNAKTALNEKIQTAKETGQYYWDEIQKDEEEVKDEAEAKTLERRAITMARHLSRHLQEGLATMNQVATHNVVVEKVQDAVTFTNDLVWHLVKATNVEELPGYALSKAKDQIFLVQDALIKVGDLVGSYWPAPEAESLESQEESLEMESVVDTPIEEECEEDVEAELDTDQTNTETENDS